MTSSMPHYLPKVQPSSTITLRIRASIYGFGGGRNVQSLAITSESLLSYIIYEGSLLPTKSNSNHLSSFQYHNWMPSKAPDVIDEPSPPLRSVSSLHLELYYYTTSVLIHYLHSFPCSFSSLGVHWTLSITSRTSHFGGAILPVLNHLTGKNSINIKFSSCVV